MATRKISELTAITAITADDLLLVVDGTTTTNKITAANAANSIVNLPSTIPTIIQTALNGKLDASAYSAAGISVKTPVVAATTTIIDLTAIHSGDSIDGVTLAVGNRLLVKNQSTASQNGIYVVAEEPTGLTRAGDFNTSGEINNGYVLVNGGTTQLGSGFIVQSTVNTVGTDPIVFVQFSASLIGLSAASFGLGNVNNTSDANKPISTATLTALNAKQNTVIGGATTITSSNLTASRALVSDANGKVGVSTVTSTELGYLDDVTSAIQAQLNGKANLASPTFIGTPVLPTATIVGTGSTTLASFGIPAGAVMPFAMLTAPAGWVPADNRELAKTGTYATLFAAIGSLYGETNGSGGAGTSHFRVPDLRGYFVRGAGTNGDLTASGSFGAKQTDELKSHTHVYGRNLNGTYNGVNQDLSAGSRGSNTNVTTEATGGTETRPKNIAMLYCIKF